jgi:SNF2 family DNA or RNA helicase
LAWIQKHEPHLDVLLTNARLVKVGLNLRMFNTAIFYEIEWSLAILWQAIRRVYRPGAPLPVRVIFPAHTGTLEERAFTLIGQKMKSASMFYGDEVASALTEEDESDFLNDLVRSVLKKKQFTRIESTFARERSNRIANGFTHGDQPAGCGGDDSAGMDGSKGDQA